MNKSISTRQTRFGIIVLCMIITGFFIVAVLFYAASRTFGEAQNPTEVRQAERLANREEITKQQNELWAKVGMNDPKKAEAVFAEQIAQLGVKKAQKSTYVVPGSKTQLEQMQAPPAAPATGAVPATAPNDAPAPATPPNGTAAPAPAAPAAPAPAATPEAPATPAAPPAASPAPAPSVPAEAPAPTVNPTPAVPDAPAPAGAASGNINPALPQNSEPSPPAAQEK